jgi:hypothetical protein
MNTPFYAVLPDHDRARIALVASDTGFSLPRFFREDGIRYHTVESVNEAVQSDWHIPVTVSRCLAEGQNGKPTIFALHNHDSDWQPPAGAQWVEASKLDDLQFDQPEHHTCVLDWLSSQKDGSWHSVPWSSPNFLAQATTWIREKVESEGATIVGAPVQIRVWAISCVLRVSTTAGTVYFKALPDFFGHEPKLVSFLSSQFSQNLVDVVAIEPDRHWMLTREMAGPEPQSREEWRLVLQTMTQIQKHCTENFAELLSLGCHDRRLMLLPQLLEPILEDIKQPEMRELYGVNEKEAHELSRRLRWLPLLCEKLAHCGIPDTLVHGDLWGPNVIFKDARTGKSPIIFDWTDGAISHPFFDIYLVLTSEKDESKRKEQRQAHIDAWSDLLPQSTVQTALELSEKVAPYYYLFTFRNVVLHAPPQARWELSYLVLRFVRKILEAPEFESSR